MREVRVYDEHRAAVWFDSLGPDEAALFYVDAKTGQNRNQYGRRITAYWDRTCLVFESLDDAERFAANAVREVPTLACRVFTREGGPDQPAKTVSNEEAERPVDVSRLKRKMALGVSFIGIGIFGIWLDYRADWLLYLGLLIGVKFLTVGPILIIESINDWHADSQRRAVPPGHLKNRPTD